MVAACQYRPAANSERAESEAGTAAAREAVEPFSSVPVPTKTTRAANVTEMRTVMASLYPDDGSRCHKKRPPRRGGLFAVLDPRDDQLARPVSIAWSVSTIFCADSSMSMTKLSIFATK